MRAISGNATPRPANAVRPATASPATSKNNPPTATVEITPAAGSTAPSNANGSTTTATHSNSLVRGTITTAFYRLLSSTWPERGLQSAVTFDKLHVSSRNRGQGNVRCLL